MKKKVLIVIGVGLLGASVSTYLFYRLMSHKVRAEAPSAQPEFSVVVAARDLPPGVLVSTQDVKVEPWLGDTLPPDAFSDPKAVAGRRVRYATIAGEPLVDRKLINEDDNWLASRIPPGKRGVTVHVGEFAGVTQHIQVGDRVDVLVANRPRSSGQANVRLTMLLENVNVIATGREPLSTGQVNAIAAVTVLVDAEDSEKLHLADQTGSIRLALRGPLENVHDLVGEAALSNAAARRAGDVARADKSGPSPREGAAVAPGRAPAESPDVAVLRSR